MPHGHPEFPTNWGFCSGKLCLVAESSIWDVFTLWRRWDCVMCSCRAHACAARWSGVRFASPCARFQLPLCPVACAIHSVCRRHVRVGTFVCGARAWRFVTERSARNETWLILKADTRVGACCVIPPHASVAPNSRVRAWISRVRAREIRNPWFPNEFHVLLWALLGLRVGFIMFARGHGRSPEHSAWRECGGSVTSPGSCV